MKKIATLLLVFTLGLTLMSCGQSSRETQEKTNTAVATEAPSKDEAKKTMLSEARVLDNNELIRLENALTNHGMMPVNQSYVFSGVVSGFTADDEVYCLYPSQNGTINIKSKNYSRINIEFATYQDASSIDEGKEIYVVGKFLSPTSDVPMQLYDAYLITEKEFNSVK